RVSVSSANAVPLTEERIKAIASSLEQKDSVSEAVEELQYRCSLKIALDILNQTDSGRQAPPAEGPNPEFPGASGAGPAPATPSRSSLLRSRSTKLQPEAAKSKRKPERKCNPGNHTRTRVLGGSVPPAGSGKAPGAGANPPKAPGAGASPAKARGGGMSPSRCGPGDLSEAPAPASHSCQVPQPKSSPGRRKTQPEPGSKGSLRAKEGRSQQGRKRSCEDDSPRDQAQLPPEEGSLPVPSKSGTVEPAERTGTQPGRTFLDSSCGNASDELEKSISSESESLAKQLDGRRKAEGGKQLDGAGVASGRDRKCRNHPWFSLLLAGLDPSGMTSRGVSSESFPPLSPLVDEEEEDFPCVLSCQVPQSIEEGMLVWCKLRRYPYWPAVVKAVKRKHRRACVLFIDGTTNEKKKGEVRQLICTSNCVSSSFSVSLKSLKHFDCEEKQELIERAKENYPQEIEWCIQLIRDYWVRVGCRSFTGSFLEYFAADISYPVRKQGHQSEVEMTFPSVEEEDLGESSSENSPQKPLRRLLPDRSRAARDRENKKLVEFIVKTKGAEEHLLGILKSRKKSRWLKKFLNSYWYVTRVETYLEDEEQLELVFDYLKEVYREMDTTNLRQILGDGIKFISDVLLPEAIIYAIAAVYDIDYKKAEEKYIKGPPVTKRERELFDEQIRAWKKLKSTLEPEES
ncbi:MUM1 protein, partial [Cephalopterus ornatus]|nr:MUM1 protein [Cephalopterus ornatus]